jgi:hypothetical protein
MFFHVDLQAVIFSQPRNVLGQSRLHGEGGLGDISK